jgi:hypothetical protein
MLQLIAAISASILGVVSSLFTIVFLMAGLANAKPPAIQQGKSMMLGIVIFQAIALIAAIWLMTHRKHWYASVVGISPLVAVIVLIIVLVKLEW